MINIKSNSSDDFFTLNGIKHPKIYQTLALGERSIGIYNIYDTRQQILPATPYTEITVNGDSYTSQDNLINELVKFLHKSVGSGSNTVKNGGKFTGVLDVSSNTVLYDDYSSGGIVNLSLSTTKVKGGTASVRIQGGLLGTLPSGSTISGDAISNDSDNWNELTIFYVSDTDIRGVNRVYTKLGGNQTGNSAPVGSPESYTITENNQLTGNVLANDTDVDGDTLTAILVSNVSNGSLNLSSNGSFTYNPNTNYVGNDSFSYKSNDGTQDSNSVTVSIVVNAASNGGSTSPSDISTNGIWLKLDTANTDAATVTEATNSLNGISPFENFGTITRSTQNGEECVALNNSGLVAPSGSNAEPLFEDSFTYIVDIKSNDGNPSDDINLIDVAGNFVVQIRETGKINVIYRTAVTDYAQSADPVFSDGAMTDFSRLAVVATNGGFIKIYAGAVGNMTEIPLNPSFQGDITAVDMTGFSGSIIDMVRTANLTGYSSVFLKNIIIQPVAYSLAQLNSLNI